MKIVSICTSVSGNVRTNNEDNLFINGTILPENHEDLQEFICSEQEDSQMTLLAVMDGVGGSYCGERASYEAAMEMQKAFRKINVCDNRKKFLSDLCLTMNEKVCQLQENYMAIMGTTVSALLFENGAVTVCNLGDSPIFAVRDGRISRIHEEHTNRRFLEKQKINRKPVLTQCLGIPEEEMVICPYIHSYEIKDHDWYLICSDGLTDMVADEDILTIIQNEKEHREKVQDLINRAMENGGKDNTTAILIHIIK